MKLILDKGKIYIETWNSKKKENQKKFLNPKKVLNILHYLQYPVALVEGFTLRDLFKTVILYPRLQLIDNYFFDYVDEYRASPDKGCGTDDEIFAINLTKEIELDEDSSYMNDSISVDGQGEKDTYAIDFSPLSELLDLPLNLNNAEVLTTSYSSTKKTKFAKAEYEADFTLWEVLHSVIWELSFHGIPKERDKNGQHILEIAKDCACGKVKTVPFEDVMKKLNEKE